MMLGTVSNDTLDPKLVEVDKGLFNVDNLIWLVRWLMLGTWSDLYKEYDVGNFI